jgi:hypothetical protein
MFDFDSNDCAHSLASGMRPMSTGTVGTAVQRLGSRIADVVEFGYAATMLLLLIQFLAVALIVIPY